MLFNRKSLINLMVPLILEQIFLGTIGIADMVMVAPVGETAISGISLVNSINMLFQSMFSALAAGGGILASQYLGKRERDHANGTARQLLVLSLCFSVAIAAVCCAGNQWFLRRLFPTAEAAVLKEAVTYFYLSALAYPCIMVFDACGALFRGMGESRIPLCGSSLMCVGNIFLNAIFIFGLDWGVFGAGFASLCAKAIGTALLLWFLSKRRFSISLRHMAGLRAEPVILKNIFRLAVPMAMEDGIFHVGKLLVQGVVTSYGTTAIAANAVALTVADFTQMPVYAIGLGLTTVVGQCIGAGETGQARRYAGNILKVSFVLAAVLSAATFIGAEPIARLYQLTQETKETTMSLIRFHALICGTVWVCAFNIPCVLRAASDVNFNLAVSIFSMWLFRVGFSYVFRETTDIGVLSVWMAMGMDWLFRGAVYMARFLNGAWLHKRFI